MCVAAVMVGLSGGAGWAQSAASWSAGVSAPVAADKIASSSTAGPLGAGTSSSLGEPEAKAAIVLTPQPKVKKKSGGRLLPFSRIASATSSGTLGFGGQIATPIQRWLNLRGGANFLNAGYELGVDGANYEGQLHLKSGQASLDFFPCRCGFHLSPGVILFHSAASATVFVPGGNQFSLGGQNFTSSPTDPVNGSASISFSRTMMPMFTFGFSNVIAKGRRHFTVPLELGAAYTGPYAAQLNLGGSACIAMAGCMSVTTPEIEQGVVEEQRELNEPMKHFQLYPIVNLGIAYKF
ncbi:MAG: hypothetical protein ABR910_11410 [Acidobacteriaceae bacterium]